MSIALRIRAVKAYADLLRVQRNLFGEDVASRLKALAHTRLKFREKSNLTEMTEIEKAIVDAEQTKIYLEQNVVQDLQVTEKTHKTTDPTPNLHF